MKKRYFFLILTAIFLLAACQSEEDPEPSPTPVVEPTEAPVVSGAIEEELEPVTVKFAVLDFEQGLYNDLIAAFEEENPDIEIEYVSIEEALDLDSLTADWPEDAGLRLVSAADVSSVFYSSGAVADNLLLDLNPLIEADPDFDESDFYPHLMERFQSESGTWAIPTEVSYQLLFYNKDAFDEAGLEYPQAGWSWDDFLETAAALTLREGDEVAQWGFVEVVPDPSYFVESRTGPLFDSETDLQVVDLDEPDLAEAMRWYTDLYLTHEVAPYFPQPDEESTGLNIPEGYSLIETGQAAMWPDNSVAFPYRSQQLNIGVVPFPADDSGLGTSLVYPDQLAVSVGTANPEAAWRWVDFLSRQTRDIGALLGGLANLPSRRSAAEASNFWEEVDQDLGSALEYAIDHTFTSSLPPAGYGALSSAFENIMDGEKLVEDAMADAQLELVTGIEEDLTAAEEDDEEVEIVVEESETEELADEDAVTIDFVAVTSPLEMGTFRDLAKQFLEINPDVIVDVKQPNLLDGSPTIQDVAATSDCFQWFPGNFSDPEIQAAILNLDPFIDVDPDVDADDFYQPVMEAFTNQGQTWGLPGQVNISLIEYNKELFDNAGLDYPTFDWTVDDFLDIAVALTQGDEGAEQYGYLPELFEPSDMLNMLDRLGGKLIDEAEDPPAIAFDDPRTVDAVRWYTSLTTEHGVKPVLLTSITGAAITAVQEHDALLNEGRAAMWVNSAYSVDLSGGEGRDYPTGAVPLPASAGAAQGSGYQSATGYFIASGTENREACWNWIKFLAEQPGVGAGLPARIDVAESAAYGQQVGSDLAAAYLFSMENSTEPPFSQQLSDENSWLGYPIFWLYNAYDQILNDGLSVEEALENAQHMADEYRACVITSEAFNDDDVQKECMLGIDDTLPAILFGSD